MEKIEFEEFMLNLEYQKDDPVIGAYWFNFKNFEIIVAHLIFAEALLK